MSVRHKMATGQTGRAVVLAMAAGLVLAVGVNAAAAQSTSRGSGASPANAAAPDASAPTPPAQTSPPLTGTTPTTIALEPAVRLPKLIEPPALAQRVKTGALPAIDKRIPAQPLIVTFDDDRISQGRYGGTMTRLMGRAKDIRRMLAFGYARLIGYDRDYRFQADMLHSFTVREGREFTFKLRKGHRWSDGTPFTTEDFRYYWEDMARNKALSPAGPPRQFIAGGKLPTVEIIDSHTIIYRWEQPNPFFLPALAGASPLFIYRPAHYLRRFHKRYAQADALKKLIKKKRRRDWVGLHFRMDRMLRLDNTKMPTLGPWMNTTKSPSERYIFKRNPYYHRIDTAGHQLPYIDRVAINITSSKLIAAKASKGEPSLQARRLEFNNYTILKRGSKRHAYEVRLWKTSRGSQIALYPNLNVKDPVWRKLVHDVRFRRALSLAIDRYEINQVIYFGLAQESGNTVLPQSPLYSKRLQKLWSAYRLADANALLDELGLTKRDSRGIRLLPDGRAMEIIVETAGEGSEHSDVLELIRDTWAKAGIKLFIKPLTREVLRRRVRAGQTVMSVFYGLDNGIALPNSAPREIAPTQTDQLNWPNWGLYHISSGKMGEAPQLPEARRLAALYNRWTVSLDDAERKMIWRTMLEIYADQVFSIGIINRVPQPVVVAKGLRNVPRKALYSWEPGGYFGVFRPDQFWFVPPPRS
ncbi:MAG: ABC transporter substrate-binding protein [Pseudomonadota bacterium]